MISRFLSSVTGRRVGSFSSPVLAGLLGMSRLSPLLVGCGGQSDALSTDTGNPPVIIGQKLSVTPSDQGVVVAGTPGAVTGGASVEVRNVTSGQSRTTMAAADGSFEVEVEGTPSDEYRIQASLGGQSASASLNSAGSGSTGLAGLEFLLESAQGYTPVTGTTIQLWFEASEFGFNAGCNGHFGNYTLCAGKLCASNLGSTDIGCGASLQAQDEWLADFVTSSPTLTHAGDRLTLAGEGATLEFLDRELANPDRPLVGSNWTVDTFIDGGAASGLPLITPPTLRFGDDGSLAVNTGCNTGYGTYTVSGSTLTLGSIPYTERGCVDTGSQFAQDHVIEVMSPGSVTFTIDAARLTIERGSIGLGATTE